MFQKDIDIRQCAANSDSLKWGSEKPLHKAGKVKAKWQWIAHDAGDMTNILGLFRKVEGIK